MLVLTPLWLTCAALAAEVTDLPPKFRGDVHVAYGGDFEQAGISEPSPTTGNDRTYAIRNTLRHDLGIRLEGAVWQGVVLTVGLPINIQQAISWPAGRQMLLEPTTGEGSYVGGQPAEISPIVSGGLTGAWLGVAAGPMRASTTKLFPLDVRLDFGVRISGKNATMYGANRGDSPGGPALRFAGAFSHRTGAGNPYLSIDYVRELGGKSAVVSNDGILWADEIAVRAPDRLDVMAGAEIIAREVKGTSTRVAIDAHLSFGYRSAAQVASGFWLPDVLAASRGVSVTTSEYLRFGGGLGLDYHVNEWIGVRIGAEGRWFTSHRVENVYAARTDDQSWGMSWSAALVGRIRLKGEPASL